MPVDSYMNVKLQKYLGLKRKHKNVANLWALIQLQDL